MTVTAERRDQWREFEPSSRQAGAPEDGPSRRAVLSDLVPQPPLWKRLLEPFGALNPRRIAGPGGSRLPVLALSLLSVLEFADAASFQSLLVFIKTDMHFSFRSMLSLISLSSVLLVVMSPISGWLSDRVPRLRLVRIGAIIGRLGTFATAFAPSVPILMGSRAAVGLSPGIERPATVPLLLDYYEVNKRPAVLGFLSMVQGVGYALGGIAAYVLAIVVGVPWRVLLFAVGVVASAATLALFVLREPERGGMDRKQLGLSGSAQAVKPASFAEVWRVCGSIHTLRRIWLAAPFITVAQQAIGAFLYFVIQARVASGELAGPLAHWFTQPKVQYLVASAPALFSVLLVPFGTSLFTAAQRRNPGRILVLVGGVLALQAIALVSFLFSPSIVLCLIAQCVVTGLGALVIPGQYIVLASVVPPRVRGQGLQTTAWFSLPGLLVLPTVGGIADTQGPKAAVIGLAVVYLVGAFVTGTAGGTVAKDTSNALAAAAAELSSVTSAVAGVDKLVVCRRLEVAFGGTTILRGLDLEVDQGELVALLGTNGAGKSTLLKALSGLTQPSGGAIFSSGEDVTVRPAFRSARDGVLYVPGGRAVFPSMTVAQNLRTAQNTALSTDEHADPRERMARVLELFPRLTERMGTRAGDLSGGEQQMLALGQALLLRPRLLMIDELSLGLAPKVVEQLLDVVREINANGTTVLLVEQSVNVATSLCDRVVYLDRGEILFDGSTPEFLSRSDLVKAAYLGGSAIRLPASANARHDAVPVLTCQDLSVTYGGVAAVSQVSVQVNAGEVVGVIGPNGAGKTSLIDLISGHVRAHTGTVVLDGVDLTNLGPDARARLGLGRAFQSARLFASLTVRQCIAAALDRRLDTRSAVLTGLWLPQARRSEQRASRRVERLIDQFGLQTFADKPVSELSTGSRRLVELACVAAFGPRLLLLDEPSTGLAQAEVEELGPVIRRIGAETGAATLLIEHDLPLLLAVADKVLALDLGRVIAFGTPAEVMNDPAVVRAYLSAADGAVHRSGAVPNEALATALASAVSVPDPSHTQMHTDLEASPTHDDHDD